MSDNLLFEVKDKVAVMTLNRPEALNAFTPEILTGWVARLEEAQLRDDVNVLLVTGTGCGFSSGGDVKRMGEGADNSPRTTKDRLWTQTQSVAKRMWEFDKPAIAAINGAAVAQRGNWARVGFPTIDVQMGSRAWFCGTGDEMIAYLKDLEKQFPGLEAVNVQSSMGTPESVMIEQLERFAAEVMPAFAA